MLLKEHTNWGKFNYLGTSFLNSIIEMRFHLNRRKKHLKTAQITSDIWVASPNSISLSI